jgi:hypothetical protein
MTDNAFISRNTNNKSCTLSFQIDLDYEIPTQILNCNVLKFQKVLTFASKLINVEESLQEEYIRTTLFAEYLKDIKQKHTQELAALEKQVISDMTSKIKPLIDTISDIERNHVKALSDSKDEYEKQIKAIKKSNIQTESDKAEQYDKELRTLSKRVSELEAELSVASKSESSIRERCQKDSDRIIKAIEEKNKEIISIKEESFTQRELKLAKQEQELQSKIQRQASSVLKGHDGEQYFKTIAKEKMNWDLIKTPLFTCDSSATINSILTLFEIKNYANNIPQIEVTKFLRDMKLHPEALFGVFISLKTSITGKNPNTPITIEWVNGSQCVLYIQACADLDLDYVFSIIDQMNRITNIFNTLLNSNKSESQEQVLRSRIEQARVYIDRAIQRGTKLSKKILADKKQQIEFIETSTTYNIAELKSQNVELTTSVQVLLSEYSEAASNSEDSIGDSIQEEKTVSLPKEKPTKSKASPKTKP